MYYNPATGQQTRVPSVPKPKPVYKPKPKPTYRPTQSYPTSVNALPTTNTAPVKDNTNSYINKLYDQSKTSQLAKLKSLQDKATSQVNQTAYKNSNKASVQHNAQVNKLRELMAANGLSGSGENVSAQVGLGSAYQGALNNIDTSKQNALNDINNPANKQQLLASIEQQRNNALAGQNWNNYQFNNLSASQQLQKWIAQKQMSEQLGQAQYQIDQYQKMLNGNFNQSGGGGDLPSSYKRDLSNAINIAGIPSNQLQAFNWIIQHESSFNPNAKNPNSSAYGYGQFLRDTRAQYEKRTGMNYNNPVDQLVMAYQYMKDRYGSPQGAMKHWQEKGWY